MHHNIDYAMAKPIKETPVLTGKDAKHFSEKIANIKPESKEEKEAAKNASSIESLDLSGIMEGMAIQVINNTSIDGTPLKEAISNYTIRKIGNQQRAVLRAKGAY